MSVYSKEDIPAATQATGVLDESEALITNKIPQNTFKPDDRPFEIVWFNVISIFLLQCLAIYGLCLLFTGASWKTILFAFIYLEMGKIGTTAGAHRLWSHRSYKAKFPLRLLLVICQTTAHQRSVIHWCKDHRTHHKFQETDADPHNANRGFFFCHIGWIMCKKHPDVLKKGKTIDFQDLYADPLLNFQHKYYSTLMPLACYILPTLVPMYLWNELFVNSFCLNILRYMTCLHLTCLVNSVAHLWGSKPYDKFINPVENRYVAILALGEGWHNYHHTFPWDYKTGELGKLNPTQFVIDQFAKIGWAYDLKTVSAERVKNRVVKTGDGSHEIWGWGDKDLSKEDYQTAVIYNQEKVSSRCL